MVNKQTKKARNANHSLGASLLKGPTNYRKEVRSSSGALVATTDGGDASGNLKSYLEANSLDDFLATAVMAGREFVAEKENVVVLDGDGLPFVPATKEEAYSKMDFTSLCIPKRPKWGPSTSPEELNRLEKESFLEWRREIALMEQSSEERNVTPFEKNLEVWRQLWRVLERSNIVIQIVDARNPLFYRSLPLEQYISEIDPQKRLLLVINKSDFLTKEQRKLWAEYFTSCNVQFIFFSAKEAQEKLNSESRCLDNIDEVSEDNNEISEDNNEVSEDNNEVSEDDNEISEDDNEISEDNKEPSRDHPTFIESKINCSSSLDHQEEDVEDEMCRVLSREGFVERLESYAAEMKSELINVRDEDEPIVIGMVGFPNVGKSSLINTILGVSRFTHGKRVGVGATPGKTKHFQTLPLTETITLCDCPGLVFPSFVNSTAEMVCCGVLPLAQLRDHKPPMALVCRRIPKIVLQRTYGIQIPQVDESSSSLFAHPLVFSQILAKQRGFMTTGKGGPDTSRAGRLVLRDYVDGKLLYCHPPPEMDNHEAFDHCLLAQLSEDMDSMDTTTSLTNAEATKIVQDVDASPIVFQCPHIVSKRMKKHGRKGRTARDKDPYAEKGVSTAHLPKMKGKHKGDEFSRAILPHHSAYSVNK